ncbi:centrosomal protein of 68 kDa [Pseudophryne corroboree]|uniref:centrosomal protein of 68 kDa n=1 Tax=Pseudophryne corroboree TaxID=495146 RepID=UPI003081A9E1
MDSFGENSAPSHTFSNQSLCSSTENKSLGPESGTSGSDSLEQDTTRSRAFLDSSWSSSYRVPVEHSPYKPLLGTCRSLYPTYDKIVDSETHLRNSQTLQEQYWACAIPNSLPPRPDRASPHWDPNKEYQELLDYTYPLNPKYSINKGKEESETDTLWHDSGVDLDSYNTSCNSKFGCSYQEDHNLKTSRYQLTNNLSSPYAFSTPLVKRTGYSGLQNPSEYSHIPYCDMLSPFASKVDHAKGSITSPSLTKYDVLDHFSTDKSPGRSLQRSGQFLATTAVLPLHKDVDIDEEYLTLPPSLKELENLATHLKDLSLNVDQGGHSKCGQTKGYKQNCRLFGSDKNYGLGNTMKTSISDIDFKDPRYVSDLFNSENHTDSETNRFSSLRDMLDGGLSSHAYETTGSPSVQKAQENKSLVQRIQRFCHHLDRLIQWLYSVAEITDNWTAPKPNVESIQVSLSLYLKLKRDVAEQRTLADTIIKDGESLVKSMALNSSVLKDTLTLISTQSGKLEKHTELLYASVLKAMDTITEENLGRNSNMKQHVSLEMESG